MIRKPKSKKTAKRKVSRNPSSSDKLIIIGNFGERLYLSDIKIWMNHYMRTNPNYDIGVMAYKAGKHFNINRESEKAMYELAFDTAEEFDYNKERTRQRKALVKTKGFPLGLGNSPFKKKNPDGQIKPRGITLREVGTWIKKCIKSYDEYDPRERDYEPRDIADQAIAHFNLSSKDRKTIIDLVHKIADEHEMSKFT